MPKLAQASPLFSAFLRVLCVKPSPSFSKEKPLTQRTQRSTEGTEKNDPRVSQGCFRYRSK
jgi:hypothetical protein